MFHSCLLYTSPRFVDGQRGVRRILAEIVRPGGCSPLFEIRRQGDVPGDAHRAIREVAVSYTHLDVYKRQGRYIADRRGDNQRPGALQRTTAAKPEFPAATRTVPGLFGVCWPREKFARLAGAQAALRSGDCPHWLERAHRPLARKSASSTARAEAVALFSQGTSFQISRASKLTMIAGRRTARTPIA